MPAAIPLAMVASSAIAGYAANKAAKTSSMPKTAPEYKPLQSTLIKMIEQRLASPSSLPQGYENASIRNINRTYNLAGQNLSNRLSARGLGSSPVAGNALTTMATDRAGQIGTMQTSLPLLERQLQTEDLGLANSVMAQGRGTVTTGPSNPWGGAFQSGSDMLAYLYGKGAFSSSSPAKKVPQLQPFTLPGGIAF